MRPDGGNKMHESSRKVTLRVDEDCYSLVEEYSDYINDTGKNVLSRVLNDTLRDYASKYKDLKQGYQEMAKMNLEISRAFRDSENEAYNRIDD